MKTARDFKRLLKKIKALGLLGTLGLFFLSSNCSNGLTNSDDDEPQVLYGPAPSECTEDADCVEQYGETFTCVDGGCIEEDPPVSCTEDADCVNQLGAGFACFDDYCIQEVQTLYGPAPS